MLWDCLLLTSMPFTRVVKASRINKIRCFIINTSLSCNASQSQLLEQLASEGLFLCSGFHIYLRAILSNTHHTDCPRSWLPHGHTMRAFWQGFSLQIIQFVEDGKFKDFREQTHSNYNKQNNHDCCIHVASYLLH